MEKVIDNKSNIISIENQNKNNLTRMKIWKLISDTTLNKSDFITNVIEIFGESYEFDRICYNKIFYESGKKVIISAYEWCSPGITSRLGVSLPVNIINNVIKQNSIVDIYPKKIIERLPIGLKKIAKPVINTLIKKYDLERVLIVPIKVRGKLDGILTFDRCINSNMKDEWEPGVVSLISEIKEIIQTTVEQKRFEKDKVEIEKRAMYLKKLALLGGGLAHEINNPLAIIYNTVQLILSEMTPDDPMRADLANILDSSKRIKDILRSFIEFSKTRHYKFSEYDIKEILEEVIATLDKKKLGDIKIEKKYGKGLMPVQVSKEDIKDVFRHIINNAVFSMKGKGKLTINILKENNDIVIYIKDTGIGIEKDKLDKIFDPEYTTKAHQRGTGLGLSECFIVITNHGGKIEATSDGPDKGAEFKVRLKSSFDGLKFGFPKEL